VAGGGAVGEGPEGGLHPGVTPGRGAAAQEKGFSKETKYHMA